MNIKDTLQREMTPADVICMDNRQAVTLLSHRAPSLVKQYQNKPEQLNRVVDSINSLEPLPLVPELPPETPYPTDALLGMGNPVFSVSDKLKVPVALVAQCALGLANSITQALVDVKKPANPRPKPTSLFFLSGAPSGEGKTLVDDILSGHLHDYCLQSDMEYQNKRYDYDMAMKAFHGEQRKIERKANLDQQQREQALKELKRPVPPVNPRFKASDVTIEGIARQFREGCTRLSIMTDEGSLLFGNHALVNERRTAVMGRLCKLWDGGQWDCDRGQQENNFSLSGRRLSMSISTQPDILRGVMADTMAQNQGFLPRFLVAMPETRIAQRQMINIDWDHQPELCNYWERLASLYRIIPPAREDSPLSLNPQILALSQKAINLYTRYGNQRFRDCTGIYEPIRSMALKAEDNLLRLAATLTIWQKPSAMTIEPEEIEAAAYLMDYYLKEGLRIADFASANSDDSDLSLAARLLAWLKATNCYLVHSGYLVQYANIIHSARNAKTIDRLMGLLVEHGHAVRLEGKPEIEGKKRLKAWLITG